MDFHFWQNSVTGLEEKPCAPVLYRKASERPVRERALKVFLNGRSPAVRCGSLTSLIMNRWGKKSAVASGFLLQFVMRFISGKEYDSKKECDSKKRL